jgi:hypothetical protein
MGRQEVEAEAVEIRPVDRADAFLVRVGGRDQSLVDLADPTRLDFDYVRRMGDVLDAVGEPGGPLRVVHVGGAGLTLPRYVAATRPRSWQVVLEPDEALTARVRSELPLPRRSGIRVRPLDGRAGVSELRDATADVVVLDAFADGEVPAELLTVEWFADAARVLVPDGVLLVNLSDRAPFALARDVVAGLRGVFADVAMSAEPATLRGRRAGNLLLVAGSTVPRAALARSATTSASPYRVLVGEQVGSSFGGGVPRSDPAGTSVAQEDHPA